MKTLARRTGPTQVSVVVNFAMQPANSCNHQGHEVSQRLDSQRFPSWNFVTFVVKGFSFTGLTEVSSSLTKTRQLIKFDLIGPISDEILGAYA